MSVSDTPVSPGSLSIAKIEAMVYRVPIKTLVQTSFGIMRDRPALFIRLTDQDGFVGYGEVWCNFPSVGAEHRARLLIECVAPLVLAKTWTGASALYESLTTDLEVLAIQSGEFGPISQLIAGLDVAAWDLVARKANQPLWRMLGGQSARVTVYASGLSPANPGQLAVQRAEEGYRAFKLKVGFGQARDLENLASLRRELGDSAVLMVDANQAWDLDTAMQMARHFAPFAPAWLEEPLRADDPIENWCRLNRLGLTSIAAGENLRGSQFAQFMDAQAIQVVQPDIAKWGGYSRCVALGRSVLDRNLSFCPHWLGGGIGLVASMHLKAAVGGAGMVEIDSNANPLRERLAGPFTKIEGGAVTLSEAPGLGFEPDFDSVEEFLIDQLVNGQ